MVCPIGNMAAPLRKTCSSGLTWMTQMMRRFTIAENRYYSDKPQTTKPFDEKMLQYLVCPLSKRPLRFSKETNELICDDIGVAYPIVNGIPNLVPGDAKKLNPKEDTTTS